jgi:hypothetical protein
MTGVEAQQGPGHDAPLPVARCGHAVQPAIRALGTPGAAINTSCTQGPAIRSRAPHRYLDK